MKDTRIQLEKETLPNLDIWHPVVAEVAFIAADPNAQPPIAGQAHVPAWPEVLGVVGRPSGLSRALLDAFSILLLDVQSIKVSVSLLLSMWP